MRKIKKTCVNGERHYVNELGDSVFQGVTSPLIDAIQCNPNPNLSRFTCKNLQMILKSV